MKVFCALLLVALSMGWTESRQIEFTNKCGYPLWVNPLTNAEGPQLGPGIVRVENGASTTYQIPDSGWGGRFWPKSGCDSSGHRCEVGQSVDPCGNDHNVGCDPPAETKVEFFFPPANDPYDVWYDVSLVDGFSLPAEIVPSVQQGSCITTNCHVDLNHCPTNEYNVGDLRVQRNGRIVQCLAPCKRWNYPPPFGLGLNEEIAPGVYLCCPTPPIWPDECRAGIIVQTQYVQLVHRECPTAYAYSYDDEAGLHNCPNGVSFKVTFCP
jgi:hypothetical protein